MARKPLSDEEMVETLADLLDSKDFKNDRDRAQFLAGMKLGIITATELEIEEARRMCDRVFLFQQTYDPEGDTWAKSDSAKSDSVSKDEAI